MMRIDLHNGNYIELHGDEGFVGLVLIALAPVVEKLGVVRGGPVEGEIAQAAESAATGARYEGQYVRYVVEGE